jgi:hypothetical protein
MYAWSIVPNGMRKEGERTNWPFHGATEIRKIFAGSSIVFQPTRAFGPLNGEHIWMA